MKCNAMTTTLRRWLACLMLASVSCGAFAGQSITNLLIEDTEMTPGRYTPESTANAVVLGTLGGNLYRSLFRAHGPDVQDGHVLTNAVLRLYVDQYGLNRSVNLHRTTTPWDVAVATWYTNMTGAAWAEPGLLAGTDYVATPTATATTPGANGFTTFNVTADVQALLNSSDASLSWLAKLPNEAQLVRFRTLEHTEPSQRPNIVYHYAKQEVQGTVVTNEATADLHIIDTAPNTPQGGTTMLAGYLISSKSMTRSLVATALPVVPSAAIIENAQLRLYQDNNIASYREGAVIRLHRLLKPWNESATWNSNGIASAWAAPGLSAGADYVTAPTDANVMPLNRHTYFDVTQDVRAFANGDAPNYGWIAINAQESGNTLSRFRTREDATASWRPALIVRYSIPPGTVLTVR
ncbi:MAG: DNRLRE domain-containing protein [Kiritimatiellia bacterium]|jgi:hypothetical protein